MAVAWWVCWDVSDSGGDVLDPERPCWLFFFFFSYLFLCQRLRERDEKEKREKEIVKK